MWISLAVTVRQRDSEADLPQPVSCEYLGQAAGCWKKVCARGEQESPAFPSRGSMMADASSMYTSETQSPSLQEENNRNLCPTDTTTVIIDSITVLLCLFGLVGNGFVFWFLSFHIKRNVFTVYILNLAAADFGFLLCLPGFLIAINVRECFFPQGHNLIYLLQLLSLLMYSSSLYLLTAISTERCVSVLFPIWHRCHRPKHLSAIVCALLWALSCLLSGIVCSLCFVHGNGSCEEKFLPMYGLNFLIFAPIMTLSSLILFIKLRSSFHRRQQGKLYVVILLTVLFFLIFAIPLSVQYFLDFIQHSLSNELSYLLASINSSINPVIYFLVGSYRQQRYRGCFKAALRVIFEEKTDSREDGESSRQYTVKMSI
ncbi:mas-related G-protein coupled receptor member H-like [Carettochelys insculpta]|uniref:mas-related G-protein coupled receptor member H-like n=1 Tax=Carettochelys insculpta TaxID=44489 RepID=UPI003EC07D7C